MALSFVGAGTATAASGASPQAVTTATALAVGDFLVVLIAYDNSGTNGADPMTGTIAATPATGALGASVSAQTGLNDPSTASSGVCARVVAFPVTTAIPSGTSVNVAWAGTVVVRSVTFGKVTGTAPRYRTNSGATGANGVGVTTVAHTTPSVNNGELVLCWAAHEYGAAITGDADTTNGSWDTRYGAFTGTTTSGIAAYFQSKVVAATATQTFNPTGTSSDWIVGSLIFREGVNVSATVNTNWSGAAGASYSDDFNRADGGLGANWTTIAGSTPEISSGSVRPVVDGALAEYTAGTFGNDQFAQVVGTMNSTVGNAGCVVRNNTGENHYEAIWNNYPPGTNTYGISRAINGTYVTLIDTPAPSATGTKTIRLEAVGSQLTMFVDGVQVCTVADPLNAHPSGKAGLYAYANPKSSVTLDNWTGGDIGGAAGPGWTATAVGTAATPPPTGSYRYWQWRATGNRDGNASYTQANEFQLLNGATPITMTAVVGMAPTSAFGPPSALNDGSTATRHMTMRDAFVVRFDAGSPVPATGYQWYTGPDSPNRDIVSWVLEASNDGIWFTTIDTKTGYATPTTANTLVGPFTITPPADPGPPTRAGGVTHRWFKFTPTARQGGGTGAVQYAELHLLSEGARIASTSRTSPAASGGTVGDDYDIDTKVIDGALANGSLTLDLGSAQNIDGYRWYTANDSQDRDPVSWTMEGSTTSSTGPWTLLDTRTAVAITADRQALAFTGVLSGSVDWPATIATSWGSWSATSVGAVVSSFGAVTEVASATAAHTTQTVAAPPGITGAVGQRVFLWVMLGSTSVANPGITPPSGFAAVGSLNTDSTLSGSGLYIHTQWFQSTADHSADANFVVTFSSVLISRMVAGTVASAGFDAKAHAMTTGASLAVPSVTTTGLNEPVLVATVSDPASTIPTPPTGFSPLTVNGTNPAYVNEYGNVKATAGATPTPTITISGTASALIIETAAWLAPGATFPFTDTFDRSDGPLGADWGGADLTAGSFAISANQATATPGTTDRMAICQAPSPGADQILTMVGVVGGGTGRFVEGALRVSSPTATYATMTGYVFYIDVAAQLAYVSRYTAGAETTIATARPTGSLASAFTIEFSVIGNALTLKINGTTVASGTDSAIATGPYSAMGFYQNGSSVNSFAFTAPPTGPTDRAATINTNWGTWSATALQQGYVPTTFTEAFASSAALTRFLISRFRCQWTCDPPATGTGNDNTGGYGPAIPGDVRVASGRLEVESGMQNYGETTLLSEGLWDMTGTIEFDLTCDANSEAQSVISVTDRPYVFTSFDGENANGPKPANGFAVYTTAPVCRIWNNYDQIDWYQNANTTTQDPGSAGPPSGIIVDGVQQHYKIEIIGGKVYVSINGTQATPAFNLPTAMTSGQVWVRIGEHNHASYKYTSVATVTGIFDNLAYNLAATARFASVAPSGTQQFGWHLETQGGTAPTVHNTSVLAKGTATAAWLLFNIGSFGDDWTTSSRVQYRLNGGTIHEVPVQIASHAYHGVFSMSIPVLVSELVNGVNTIAITGTGFTHASDTRYANVQLAITGGVGYTEVPATIASNWGTWTATALAAPTRVAIINTNWGGWTATGIAAAVKTGIINTNWGTWTATAVGSGNHPATIATSWGTWSATALAQTEHKATIATTWGTWSATALAAAGKTATIASNWGTWTATAVAQTEHKAIINTNWGGWDATALGLIPGKASATIDSNWGGWTATAVAQTAHVATINTNWGGWTATAVTNPNRSATIATSWGTWTATALATNTRPATISTNWGGWTATAIGEITHAGSGIINTNWGGWTATALAQPFHRSAAIFSNWGTWIATASGAVSAGGNNIPAHISTNWSLVCAGPGVVLNQAEALYLGSTPATAAYVGNVKVWPP